MTTVKLIGGPLAGQTTELRSFEERAQYITRWELPVVPTRAPSEELSCMASIAGPPRHDYRRRTYCTINGGTREEVDLWVWAAFDECEALRELMRGYRP